MLLTNRFGVTASWSRRVQLTALAGSASTFLLMNTRPVVVAAHAVERSAAVRSIAATANCRTCEASTHRLPVDQRQDRRPDRGRSVRPIKLLLLGLLIP